LVDCRYISGQNLGQVRRNQVKVKVTWEKSVVPFFKFWAFDCLDLQI